MKKTLAAIAAPIVICSIACGSAPQDQELLGSTQTQEVGPKKKEALAVAPVSTSIEVSPPASGISIYPWWLYEAASESDMDFFELGDGPSGTSAAPSDASCSVDWSSSDEVAVPAGLATDAEGRPSGCVAGVTYKYDKNNPAAGGPIWACPSTFAPSAAYVVFDVGNEKSTWSPSACIPPANSGWELVRNNCDTIPVCLIFGNMGCNGPCNFGP